MLFHHLRRLQDRGGVHHGVGIARNVEARAAVLLCVFQIREALVGLLEGLVFDEVALVVEVEFVLDGGEFVAGLHDGVRGGRELDRRVGLGFGREIRRIHRVDVAFDQHLRELSFVVLGARRLGIGSRNAHADVVDGQAVDRLHARARKMAVRARHDVFGVEAPVGREAARDFGLTAKFVARRRNDAHDFHVRGKARVLGFGRLEVGEKRLHRGIGVNGGRRVDRFLVDRRNEGECHRGQERNGERDRCSHAKSPQCKGTFA